MKKSIFRIAVSSLIAVAFLCLAGCGYPEYMRRTQLTNMNATQTVTRYESTNYKVLGLVTAYGESRCIMGILVEGTEGEALLWDAAKSTYGDRVTGIKDINSWYEYQSVLPPLFSEIYITYVGTAVHEE